MRLTLNTLAYLNATGLAVPLSSYRVLNSHRLIHPLYFPSFVIRCITVTLNSTISLIELQFIVVEYVTYKHTVHTILF